MKLKDLLKDISYSTKADIGHVQIEGLSFDSHCVKQNDLYFCLNGSKVDGHNFAKEAIQKGAKALVVEHYLDVDIPQIVVDDARASMALISANFYDNPAQKLKIIGVTGTNGKTSTTYILRSILQAAGYKVGVIGTIGILIGEQKVHTTMTTPDPIVFHHILDKMVQNGVDYVVMEVSAHALALQKVAGITFEVGILTNITQDHLDYFKTFSHYATTKLGFISPNYCKCGVVNLDDKLVRSLYYKYANSNFLCKGFGIECDIDAQASDYVIDTKGIMFNVRVDGHNLLCKSKLLGKFNLHNIMGAIVACKSLGISDECICQGIQNIEPIPGRFNVVELINGASVVIDYAHTPDGLAQILSSARELCRGKLISVFGCGGNRDATKRPMMGQISSQLADYTIITSDNPRFEKPADIILDIKKGVVDRSKVECILARQKAIEHAVQISNENDIIVISGKGVEDYIDIQGKKLPYSDYEVVKKINNCEVLE